MKGQHAVVTGGGRGIGAAIAEALIAQGAQVTIMGRDQAVLAETAARIGAQALTVDVTQPAAVQQAFEQAGAVDILVNNAGTAESAPFHRTDFDLWQRMIAVNLNGVYLCTQAVVREMVKRGYGRIINIASTAALTGYPYVTAYCAAKHGVIGLTRALARELATSGVTVNAICPGYTDTDLVTAAVKNIVAKTQVSEEAALAQLIAHNPQKHLIEPAEIAQAVIWLCASASVTGQSIPIDGGEIL